MEPPSSEEDSDSLSVCVSDFIEESSEEDPDFIVQAEEEEEEQNDCGQTSDDLMDHSQWKKGQSNIKDDSFVDSDDVPIPEGPTEETLSLKHAKIIFEWFMPLSFWKAFVHSSIEYSRGKIADFNKTRQRLIRL